MFSFQQQLWVAVLGQGCWVCRAELRVCPRDTLSPSWGQKITLGVSAVGGSALGSGCVRVWHFQQRQDGLGVPQELLQNPSTRWLWGLVSFSNIRWFSMAGNCSPGLQEAAIFLKNV